MKKLILSVLIILLSGCAPMLKSTVTPPPDVQTIMADRAVMKGFEYKETYLVGKTRSYSPSVGMWYKIGNWGKWIANQIGVAFGIQFTKSYQEKFGDIGTVRNKVKDFVEDAGFAKSVVTFKDEKELRLADTPDKIIIEGKSGNEAVVGATPWYWGVYNVFDYMTLLAFLGVPVHYEKEANVTVGIYNERYERLAKYEGYAHVIQKGYVYPDEVLVGMTLQEAYRDALNKAARDWNKIETDQSNGQ